MATEKRLIDANDLMATLDEYIQVNRDQDSHFYRRMGEYTWEQEKS